MGLLRALLLGTLMLAAGQVQAALKRDEARRVLTGAEVSVLRDPTREMDLQQVRAPETAARFKPISHGLSVRPTKDVLWLRIALQRESSAPADWLLELSSPLIDDLRLYALDGERWTEQQAGDRHPFADRLVPYRRPVFAMNLPDTAPHVFYMRVQTESAIAAHLLAWQPMALVSAGQADLLWMGALVGASLISGLFFLNAWILNRDRLLLAAAGVTLTFMVAAAANLGLINQYLWPRNPELADALMPLSTVAFFICLFPLFARALDLPAGQPRLWLLLRCSIAAFVAAALARLTGFWAPIGSPLLMLGMISGFALISIASWRNWSQRGVSSWPFALGLTALSASFSVPPLMVLGVLAPSVHFELFWVVSSVGFMFLAQTGVLQEVRTTRKARHLAESETRMAQQQAEQESAWRQQQTRFFVGVAHDLRTPLGAIRVGLVNLERAIGPADEASRQRLERMQKSLKRVAELIERHLELQRLEQADFELVVEPVSPLEVAERARTTAAEAWPQRSFKLKPAAGLPEYLPMDDILVEMALLNLLSNAAKHAMLETPIEIELRPEQGGVGFAVRDRGPGVDPHRLDDLLQLHWKRSAAPSDAPVQGSGFGIGLPMVQRICVLHGGRLVYRREADGWSVFEMWVPRPA